MAVCLTSKRAAVVETARPLEVAVVAASSDTLLQAKRIAANYGLNWISAQDSKSLSRYTYRLVVSSGDLALHGQDQSHGPVSIDFTRGRSAHRRRFGGGRNQSLARAVGVGKQGIHTVLDATAGYGSDAFVLASLGCSVTLLERHPALAAMLQQAITRARADDSTAAIARQMQLLHTDATVWLLDSNNIGKADTVYLDPMYPQRTKSALVKKNMQALHAIAGPDTDSEFLLHAALSAAGRRVVVKRPKSAAALSGRAPDTCISSSNTRYDIYLL